MTLGEATKSDILSNAGLYFEMIRIMKIADGVAPKGSCCGRNKEQHIDKFLQNKNTYMNKSEEIKNRKIQPKWKGVIYVAKLKTHFSADTMTDAKARQLISQNILTPVEKYFDLPETEIVTEPKAEAVKEDVKEAENKTSKRKTKKTKK